MKTCYTALTRFSAFSITGVGLIRRAEGYDSIAYDTCRARATARGTTRRNNTAIISWRLPGLWLEPFGPVAKNLPVLALLLALRELEGRR